MHNVSSPRRIGFLGAVVLGVTAIAVTAIVSGSFIVLYGMKIVDGKATNLTEAVRVVLEELPAIRAALPPALADAMNDQRRPDYASQLKIDVRMNADAQRPGRSEPVIAVENLGEEVVSMLALRIVALDASKNPVREWTEYLATPLAIENDWRGPLMPASTRRAILSRSCPKGATSIECEVAELRVWEPNGGPAHTAAPRFSRDSQEHSAPEVEIGPSQAVVLSTQRGHQP